MFKTLGKDLSIHELFFKNSEKVTKIALRSNAPFEKFFKPLEHIFKGLENVFKTNAKVSITREVLFRHEGQWFKHHYILFKMQGKTLKQDVNKKPLGSVP